MPQFQTRSQSPLVWLGYSAALMALTLGSSIITEMEGSPSPETLFQAAATPDMMRKSRASREVRSIERSPRLHGARERADLAGDCVAVGGEFTDDFRVLRFVRVATIATSMAVDMIGHDRTAPAATAWRTTGTCLLA